MTEEQKQLWAVVQLFGHAKIAGAVSEQTFGGAAMLRVDVPRVEYVEHDYHTNTDRTITIAAHTRSFGPGAIYSIDWCDEAAAILAATQIKHRPINGYGLKEVLREMTDRDRQRLLAGPVVDIESGERDPQDEIPY